MTGPKRLEFRPGDHATAEATGLFGLPNDVWTDRLVWFDHYLRGVDNGIDREQPVQLKPRTTGAYEGYPDWKSVGATSQTDRPRGHHHDPHQRRLGRGRRDHLPLQHPRPDRPGPPMASIPLLPRRWAAVSRQSERYASVQRVRGTTTLHTTLTPTEESGTLVAYLYDVGPLGLGKLVSNAPYTFHGRTPGKPFGVDLELYSTAYDVPAGHRLALVVDTVDPLDIEHNPSGAQLTFSSPANDPSYVSVPLREQ